MHQLILGLALLLPLIFHPASAAEPQPYAAQSEATQAVAEPYFKAYVALDWDRVESLLADQASFNDPTAAPLFGGLDHQGKAAVMKGFREGYASIISMHFTPRQVFHSGPYAVFAGDLDWSMRLPDGPVVRTVMPFVTTLRVEAGKVVQHQDLADYRPYLAAVRRAKPAMPKP